MKDIFGTDIHSKEISLSIYCDERKINGCQHPNNENWLYIALLIVPDSKKSEVLATLNKHRGDTNYYYELKFRKLNKPSCISTIARLAELWLKEVIWDTNKRFYFKILGIKEDNLLFELFGGDASSKGKHENIYNRFFRANFLGALNSYFPQEEYAKITISGLFHDRQGRLEAHEFFPWHLCYKVSDERVNFLSDQLCFIDSDHRAEPKHKDCSQFIQLADLLVGSISHCLDLPAQSSEGKDEVAKVILPLLKEILGGVYSKRSRFDYFRKYDVSFYPSKKLTLEEFYNDADRAQSQFFKERRILLEEKLSDQLPLPLSYCSGGK